jgi:predicted nucleotidyltransferase
MQRALESFLAAVIQWAANQTDIMGVALVGSYARGEARADSDVDLVVLTKQPDQLLAEPSWAAAFGAVIATRIEPWGRVTSLRVSYRSNLEVEYGITTPAWAKLPADEGTRRVVADGMVVLFDRHGALQGLLDQVSAAFPQAENRPSCSEPASG